MQTGVSIEGKGMGLSKEMIRVRFLVDYGRVSKGIYHLSSFKKKVTNYLRYYVDLCGWSQISILTAYLESAGLLLMV